MKGLAIPPETFRFTVVLGLLAALPSLSIDISQPTLIAVESQLVSSGGTVGLTITLFMCGFALGQFGGGPLSDQHGRRPVLLTALVAFIMAGLGCSTAATAPALVAWRFLQGIAAGACAVMAFTMIRDVFDGEAARSKRAYVIVVLGLAPLLAPTLGAWVLEHWGWRPVFVLLSAAGVLLLVAVGLGVDETRAPVVGAPRRRMGASYRVVLKDPHFLGLAVLNALSYGVIFAYIAGSPQVLMGELHLTGSGYGAFFACTAGALTLGAYVSGRATKAGVGPRGLIWLSLVLAATSATALMVLLAIDMLSLMVLLPLLVANLFARGITGPNTQHLALEPMKEQAGTASAAIGVMQILAGAIASGVVALLMQVTGPAGMAAVMSVLSVASLVLWLAICRRS